MLAKRIIPCLDVQNGRTVKGTNFVNLKDAGDPVEQGKIYADQGADELVFLDITATVEKRKILADLVFKVAQGINIPFSVGGGISCVEDVSVLLNAGADKVVINSAAVEDPSIIEKLAKQFGSQCIVLAVDTKVVEGINKVFVSGGRRQTARETLSWIKQAYEAGAGEIILTSIDHDGTKNGFATELTARVSGLVPIPVVASGGAGSMNHFVDIFQQGKSDAALAASIFHFKEVAIKDLKHYLSQNDIEVRL
ncbi:MAG: imidazole glycerol phosphate synthase subunit HisF [Bacteriovoracaceae bacterium]|nr:imidazole glycerol phosphate synthase subunit HisF [Bacteriovoracaceae bacterium]